VDLFFSHRAWLRLGRAGTGVAGGWRISKPTSAGLRADSLTPICQP